MWPRPPIPAQPPAKSASSCADLRPGLLRRGFVEELVRIPRYGLRPSPAHVTKSLRRRRFNLRSQALQPCCDLATGLFYLWEDAKAPYHCVCERQVRTMMTGNLKALFVAALIVITFPASAPQAQVTETVA